MTENLDFMGFSKPSEFELDMDFGVVLSEFYLGQLDNLIWRVVREAEGAGLENQYTARYLGFKSLTLRHGAVNSKD